LLLCRHFLFQNKSSCNTGRSYAFLRWKKGWILEIDLSFVTGVTCQQVKSLACIGMLIVLDG
jgi:hypothetical protein